MFAGLQVKCHIHSFRIPSIKIIITALSISIIIIIIKNHTHSWSCPSFCLREMKVCLLVEISRVLRCSYHTTADQERAPTLTKRGKKKTPSSAVTTLAVILTKLKRDNSNLRRRRVYTPGAIHHL